MNNKSPLACALIGTMLTLASCVCEDLADNIVDMGTRATMVEMSLTMPMSNTNGQSDGYDYGNTYENTISSYRIYFYDSTSNTFITELTSSSISSINSSPNEYTITGELAATGEENPLENYSNFKVVMIANWESYETPAEDSTIEDLCDSECAQYTALTSEEFGTKSLPFYGVHTYTGVTFKKGTTHLNGTLALLRAVAKVEIILNNEDDGDNNITLASATLHNYNAKGYCTPKDVNSEDDYGKATDWASDYTGNNLHLVNDKNDDTPQSELQFVKTQDREVDANGNVTQKETWIAYIPEYDNTGNDFAYISLRFDHQLDTDNTEYNIYFAVYDNDGTTKAYSVEDGDSNYDTEIAKRRDVHRNNLYRYNVTLNSNYELRVFVDTWENVFDNAWTYGTMSEIMEAGATFEIDDKSSEYYGTYFEVVSDNEESGLTVKIKSVPSSTSGQYTIPETIKYLGYTYTVVGIGANCFDSDTDVTVISIPSTVTYIEGYAFEGDTGLVTIIFHSSTPPDCAENAFTGDTTDQITIYIPDGSKDSYSKHDVWGQFQSVEVSGLN